MILVSNSFSYQRNFHTLSSSSSSSSSFSLSRRHIKSKSLCMSSIVVEKKSPSVNSEGTSSMAISSLNLMKNCVGAGVFSLHSRVTSISPNPGILLPASGLILLMAMWATYNFYMIGETCTITNSSSYGEAWGNTVSKQSQWIVQTVVVLAPIVSCLANTIVLTDILGLIMKSMGLPSLIHSNRNVVIAVLGSLILYPLCILKDLSALKSVSIVGIGGHLTAMAAFAVRLFDKSYTVGGQYYSGSILEKASLLPKLAASPIDPSKWFILAALLSYCFVAHYNAPRYYTELKDKDKDQYAFLKMAGTAYLGSASIYIGTIALAMSLFGRHSYSFALNNFVARDPIGLIARVAFGTSVLASYPLIFLAMRNWFVQQSSKVLPAIAEIKKISAILLLFICFLTTKVSDIGIVGSIAGGIFGSSMMFVFPPLMYIGALKKQAKDQNKPLPMVKIILNIILMIAGGSLGITGTANTIKSIMKR